LQGKNNFLKGFSDNDITERKQVEEVRILSESNLQALINDKEVSMWSLDNNYNLIVCNDFFRNAFLAAYQVELKVGINLVNILSPELKALWKPKYDATLLGEKISFEFKETIQGKLFYFNLFLKPILEDGKVTGVSALSVDITKIKKAHIIKNENEKLFRVFLENSDAVILLVDPESGRIVFANDSAVKYYGWEKEKLLHMNVNQINTLSSDEIKAKIAEAREKKQNYFVFKHRLANGNIRDVEVYQTKMYFEKKELFSVIIHDITERLLAENLLHSFEFKFRTFSDYTADWEFWEDEHGEIIYMSPLVGKITGYTFDEFVSDPKLLFSIIHPDDADSMEKHHEKTFNSQDRCELHEIEYRIIKKDGLVITLQHTCRPIFDAENKFLGRRISNRDITERNQAKQELIKAKEKAEESDQLKSAFLANMSHEIRTPMNGILGFADLLKDQELTSDEQQVYIKIIKKSGERLLNIINDLIDISKVEAGQMEVFNSDVNVNEQIEYIYDFFRPEVENKGMQLFFQNGLPAEEAVIRTDSEKLYAILTNLVKNAIKYSDTGTIEIGYNLKNEYLKFFIKDTGIGIPHNKQEAIFDRFVQADISDKKLFKVQDWD